MKRHALIYGLVCGALIALLQWIEYRRLVMAYSGTLYGALIAALFAALGIWLGIRITRRPPGTVPNAPASAASVPAAAGADAEARRSSGLTQREFEILELIARGMSNREIAESLFVSENTVKTHASRVLAKLGARRRTQAVQMGKQLGLLP